MSQLKLFADAISPVCRSVMLLLSANGIQHDFVEVSLKAGDNHTNEDFIATNPCKRIPSIDDTGYTLFESVAILRYICQKYKVPNNWYPSDLLVRSKVEEALAWFPGNLRCGCFYEHCIGPIKLKRPRNDAKCAELRVVLKNSLDIIENYFLNGQKFVAGDEISIADLEFLGEVTQYWVANCDIYKGRPNMERWMEDCKKELGSHFESIYTKLYSVRNSGVYHYHIDVGQTTSEQ